LLREATPRKRKAFAKEYFEVLSASFANPKGLSEANLCVIALPFLSLPQLFKLSNN